MIYYFPICYLPASIILAQYYKTLCNCLGQMRKSALEQNFSDLLYKDISDNFN